jgi:uncharacterized RDD family membrane protein YckC
MAYCVRCGAEYSVAERTCRKCGASVPDLLPPPAHKSIERQTASPFKRAVAGGLDAVLVAAMLFYLHAVVLPRLLLRGRNGFIAGLAVLALPAFYVLLRDALSGKSLGKLLIGITVINAINRRPAGIADSVLRNIVLGFVVVPYVGWAIAAAISLVIAVQILSGRSDRWGDAFARTLVVDDADVEVAG